jgi:hypothetical protein
MFMLHVSAIPWEAACGSREKNGCASLNFEYEPHCIMITFFKIWPWQYTASRILNKLLSYNVIGMEITFVINNCNWCFKLVCIHIYIYIVYMIVYSKLWYLLKDIHRLHTDEKPVKEI